MLYEAASGRHPLMDLTDAQSRVRARRAIAPAFASSCRRHLQRWPSSSAACCRRASPIGPRARTSCMRSCFGCRRPRETASPIPWPPRDSLARPHCNVGYRNTAVSEYVTCANRPASAPHYLLRSSKSPRSRRRQAPLVRAELPVIDGRVALSFLELMELRVVKALLGRACRCSTCDPRRSSRPNGSPRRTRSLRVAFSPMEGTSSRRLLSRRGRQTS